MHFRIREECMQNYAHTSNENGASMHKQTPHVFSFIPSRSQICAGLCAAFQQHTTWTTTHKQRHWLNSFCFFSHAIHTQLYATRRGITKALTHSTTASYLMEIIIKTVIITHGYLRISRDPKSTVIGNSTYVQICVHNLTSTFACVEKPDECSPLTPSEQKKTCSCSHS